MWRGAGRRAASAAYYDVLRRLPIALVRHHVLGFSHMGRASLRGCLGDAQVCVRIFVGMLQGMLRWVLGKDGGSQVG